MTVDHDRAAPAQVHRGLSQVDAGPPARSKLTAGLSALACAACCVVPLLLVSTGVLTAAGAAVVGRSLVWLSLGLLAVSGAMWWLHWRRSARRAAAAVGGGGCGNPAGTCGC